VFKHSYFKWLAKVSLQDCIIFVSCILYLSQLYTEFEVVPTEVYTK